MSAHWGSSDDCPECRRMARGSVEHSKRSQQVREANEQERARRLIRTDGTESQLDQPVTTATIRLLIGANSLDTVQLRHLGRPAIVMFVDDLGHDKNLPVNEKATALYLANCRPGTTHTIRGDVVIAPDNGFGGPL